MAIFHDDVTLRASLAAKIARIPTGAKLFFWLSAGLLPLALIAVFATLQTTRVADQDARARLRVAASESSRALTIEMIGDATALRVALDALDADPANTPVCARVQAIFTQHVADGAEFLIASSDGQILCGKPVVTDAGALPVTREGMTARVLPGRGVALSMLGPSGRTRASALFSRGFLAETGRPTGFVAPYELKLSRGNEELLLHEYEVPQFARLETHVEELGLDGLTLQMSVRSAPLTSPILLAMLLPLIMWAAAAAIGWFVVDRLMIRPLRELRANAAAYVPGEIIDPREISRFPAQEIRELGDTFRAISRTVALHEADLAAGLIRQTKLTKEVHHRVKNNLQVIASLINFHSRGATHEEASAAYASIQRRVDALAVVHRNHHAEMEDNRGLGLRGMIGELASNIRATASEKSSRLGITLDVQPFLVNQDVAVAVAFLITEIIELAMSGNPEAQIRISLREGEGAGHAVLRVGSAALVETEALRHNIDHRYGRVMLGLARQLRGSLHHDPLGGIYEISIAVAGRE
jgi:two-component sensor histidine kinase